MKQVIYFIFLIYSITCYSQTKEFNNYILFNHSSDTIVRLNVLTDTFNINTNFNKDYAISIFHIRENKLISHKIFSLTNFQDKYTCQPLTDDIFLVQISSKQSDSVFQYKRFHIVNTYVDNITKSTIESINRCNDSIYKPYAFTFNIFINDKKISDYEVIIFRTFKTHQTAEYASTTIYSDSVPVKRDGNCFYFSEKFDSIGILIKIGKSGKFFYEITNSNFGYGASLYFAVSTNDKKLDKKYNDFVRNKEYYELRKTPYMSIVKHYSDRYSYGKKHSVLYIDCNEKCNPTAINYAFRHEWHMVKDLK